VFERCPLIYFPEVAAKSTNMGEIIQNWTDSTLPGVHWQAWHIPRGVNSMKDAKVALCK
jgi:hypothetical protein